MTRRWAYAILTIAVVMTSLPVAAPRLAGGTSELVQVANRFGARPAMRVANRRLVIAPTWGASAVGIAESHRSVVEVA